MLLHLHVRAQSPPHVRYVYSTIVVERGRQHRACRCSPLLVPTSLLHDIDTGRAGLRCHSHRQVPRPRGGGVLRTPGPRPERAKDHIHSTVAQHGCHLVFALARCRSHGPRAAFPGSPGWPGGCLACLLPWPGRSRGRPSRSQPMMRDWCAGRSCIGRGAVSSRVGCVAAAFSWLVGNGQAGGVRPGESTSTPRTAPSHPFPSLNAGATRHGTARSRSGDSSALPPC